MPRSYGRIAVNIWSKEEFAALTPTARLTYLMLITQGTISACGVLAITLNRWATAVLGDGDIKRLQKALDELERTDFIVTDAATDELLVRTFVKHDGGAESGNRVKAVVASVAQIASPKVLRAVLTELDKVGITHGFEAPPDDDPEDPAEDPSKALPSPSTSPPVKAVVALTEPNQPEPQPQPATENQDPKNISSTKADVNVKFTEFWSVYPKKVSKQAALKVFTRIVSKGSDPDAIIAGAKVYATAQRGVDVQYVKNPDGWLNAGRWEDETPAAAGAPHLRAVTSSTPRELRPAGWEFGH